jgi:hypothetical protein
MTVQLTTECEKSYEIGKEYPLADFAHCATKCNKVGRGAFIRLIPAPPAPEQDIVLSLLVRKALSFYKASEDSECLLQIYGFLPEECFNCLRDGTTMGPQKLFATDISVKSLREGTSCKMKIIADNFFEYYLQNAQSCAMTSLIPVMPTACARLVTEYMGYSDFERAYLHRKLSSIWV